MMTEIDEEEDWATSDEVAEDDSDSNAVVAESALDRMACGLGGKTMFPHILNATPQMLQQVKSYFLTIRVMKVVEFHSMAVEIK